MKSLTIVTDTVSFFVGLNLTLSVTFILTASVMLCLHWPSLRAMIICRGPANFSAGYSFDITLFALAESLTSFPAPMLIGLPESRCINKRHR